MSNQFVADRFDHEILATLDDVETAPGILIDVIIYTGDRAPPSNISWSRSHDASDAPTARADRRVDEIPMSLLFPAGAKPPSTKDFCAFSVCSIYKTRGFLLVFYI